MLKILVLILPLFLLQSCKTSQVSPSSESKGASGHQVDRTGVWLTNVGSKVLYSKASIDAAASYSQKLGINSLYPVVWNKQEVFLESETVKKYLGASFISSPEGMDVLKEVVESARSRNMTTYAWYENGLKVPVKTEAGEYFELGRVLKNKGWLTTTQSGAYTGKCEFGVCKGFLNPFKPEVRKFLLEFAEEICRNYDVEGFMVDDHFSMDPSFGYDKFTLDRYYDYIAKKGLKDTQTEFDNFRSSEIVTLLNDIKNAARKHGKKFILSPGGDPEWSKKSWLLDWEKVVWLKAADEIIMQSYRYDMLSFQFLINGWKLGNLAKTLPFSTAILTGLKNNTKTTGKLIYEQTKAALDKGYGVSYFYYDTFETPASGLETKEDRDYWLEQTANLLKR